jgi:hypothetical protein
MLTVSWLTVQFELAAAIASVMEPLPKSRNRYVFHAVHVLGATESIFALPQSACESANHFPMGTNAETGIVSCKFRGVPN